MTNFAVLYGLVMTNPIEVADFNGSKSVSFILCTSEQWIAQDGRLREHTEKHFISIPLDEYTNEIKKDECIYLVGKIALTQRLIKKTGELWFITEIVPKFYDIIGSELPK